MSEPQGCASKNVQKHPPTNLSFHVANQIFSQELGNDGHFVTECEGTFGHNMPNEMYGWPNFWIRFLQDHPRGTVGSPYITGGLPSIFPNYCRIPQ